MSNHNYFLDKVKNIFSFLEKKYNFSLESVKIDKHYPSIIYKRKDIAIEVRLEVKEQYFIFYIIKLEDGILPSYLDSPNNWIYIEEIIKLKDPEYILNQSNNFFTKETIIYNIEMYAKLCKKYCTQLLDGDLSLFDKVIEHRKRN